MNAWKQTWLKSLAAFTGAGLLIFWREPPTLLDVGVSLIVSCCVLALSRRYTFTLLHILALTAFIHTWSLGYTLLHSQRLNLPSGRVSVCGWINGLPLQHQPVTSFNFQVNRTSVANLPNKTIRLTWYYPKNKLVVGDYWCFKTHLKLAHGLANPGGFDFELWSLLQGIQALGNVSAKHATLHPHRHRHYYIEASRQRLLDTLHALPDIKVRGLIAALTLGVREMPDAMRILYQRAGISHLIAISGLHVGLIAGVAYLLFYFIFKLTLVNYQRPHADLASCGALLSAGCYALLAGLSLPTQRALMMLALASLARLRRVKISLSQNVQAVFFISVMINPWCLFDISFCLSFIAVVMILLSLVNYTKSPWSWCRLQLTVSLGLLPITCWVFKTVSLIGVFINFFAIPWVSFIILPASLLVLLTHYFSGLNHLVVWFTHLNIQVFHWIILQCLKIPYATLSLTLLSNWQFITLYLIVLLIIAPKQWPAKPLVLFLIPIFCYPYFARNDDTRLTVLDVGQGLSVIFQYRDRVLIYDTGPRYGQADAGERVIIPFLQQMNLQQVDTIVISHGDLDHRGGLASLVKHYAVRHLYSSEPHRLRLQSVQNCQRGQHWRWDHIHFDMLHPGDGWRGNNASCVLSISFNGYRIILPGDIEARAESQIASLLPQAYPTTVLLAPHHGSKTSSSDNLLTRLQPRYIVFSAGHQNRFHFPHRQVTEKVCQHAVCFNTARDGAVQFTFKKEVVIARYRDAHHYFWSYPYLNYG